jgi:uncharacterized membrane protein
VRSATSNISLIIDAAENRETKQVTEGSKVALMNYAYNELTPNQAIRSWQLKLILSGKT